MKNCKTVFCVECRKETTYQIIRVPYRKVIGGKGYTFEISEAICDTCGEAIGIHGLMDANARDVERQYKMHTH